MSWCHQSPEKSVTFLRSKFFPANVYFLKLMTSTQLFFIIPECTVPVTYGMLFIENMSVIIN